MQYWGHKESAFWFYVGLVVLGIVTVITYRKDPVSMSAGIATLLIGVAMLLLPPLLRGGRQLTRFAMLAGAAVSLVTIVVSGWRDNSITIILPSSATLSLILLYVLTNHSLLSVLKDPVTIFKRPASAAFPKVSPKGYLDHKVDSAKGRDDITRILSSITKITNADTQRIKAGTAKLVEIYNCLKVINETLRSWSIQVVRLVTAILLRVNFRKSPHVSLALPRHTRELNWLSGRGTLRSMYLFTRRWRS